MSATGLFRPAPTGIDLSRTPGACPFCSTRASATIHGGPCPEVRSVEYYPDGRVKRVEYRGMPSYGYDLRSPWDRRGRPL